MSSRSPVPPRLILAVGNPSRGDDALGYLFAERARERLADLIADARLEVLTDFQLQVEHALDLRQRDHVLFVDASVDAPPPFTLGPVGREAPSALSHAMSPAALMHVLETLGEPRPARVEVLAIRAESFELGDPLSEAAARHLEEALRRLPALLGLAPTPSTASATPAGQGLRLKATGVVQGVGFRPFVARTARALGLTGQVQNGPDGVIIDLFGPPPELDRFIATLQSAPPPGAELRSLTTTPLDAPPPPDFQIAPSQTARDPNNPGPIAPARLSIPPDLALCPDCRRELADPTDRHFDHAFTSCTACGPRLSIATGLPYDRAHTAMAHFTMCPECATEYATESDRRFHAQAIACPGCGPTLALLGPDRRPLSPPSNPLDQAAELLRQGHILALQGLGGFHLACDATNPDAVARLRHRKSRDAKPFAVMVSDLEAARLLIDPEAMTPELEDLLLSPVGPIVLAPGRPAASTPLAANVGAGSSRVGVFLPTTPLHARLLARLGQTPLVMTSGNLSGEPVALTHDEAFASLATIADALLVHDRPIVRRVEDSVVSVGSPSSRLPPRVIRRARGYAPRPIRLPVTSPEPILAVGGHMKNTAAVLIGDECWLTPHLGDLDTHTAERAWVREVEGFERLLGVRCELVVHDAHPDYATTRYAERRAPEPHRRLAVQHHHAHALAVLAERRTLEPVLALAFDGTGWGPDGTAWGGEVLRLDPANGLSFTRPTALRPIPLPGGERAIHEVWRAAYGALFDTFGPETPALVRRLQHVSAAFAGPHGQTLGAIHEALERGVGVVRARGLGRLFDAVGSLVLGRATASFEGEIPMRLEELAADAPGLARPYPFETPSEVGTSTTLSPAQQIDLRPTWRALVDDLLAPTPPSTIAARLHATIVAATLTAIERHQLAAGLRRVVLTGGALMNRRLERAFRDAFGPVVLDPMTVPVHDGGLALGQALAGALHFKPPGARPCV